MDTSSHNESIKGSFMKSIDIKSLLIGILGTALVMVLMGVTHKKGSYQIACMGSGCYLLNTNTGIVKVLKLVRGRSIMHDIDTEADF